MAHWGAVAPKERKKERGSENYGTVLQSHVDSLRIWYAANSMKLDSGKTRVMAITRKTNNALGYSSTLCDECITRTDSPEFFRILNAPVTIISFPYIFNHAKFWTLHTLTHSFSLSTLHCPLPLFNA